MFLDTREGDLHTILGDKQIPFDSKQLPVGDIWIGTDEKIQEGALIIERKSIRDLEASVLDGRYREQRGRILAFCQENKTQPMYILEGSLSSATGRLQKKALMKIIHRLIFHYQISVMQTSCVQETAELITTLLEQWNDDPASLKRTNELVKVEDGLHIQKKVNAADPKQFAIMCLAQCPGVSIKMAEVLINTFGTLKNIIARSAEELATIKVGNRKIGPVVSSRLHEIMNS